MNENYTINYLRQLEAESINIIRETVAGFKNPVMFYSIGKDSSVMLHLAKKAFYPGKVPFPVLHIDTGYEFKQLLDFRDYVTSKIGVKLISYKNCEPKAEQLGSDQSHTDLYIYYKKTKPLLEMIKKYNFDAGIGGARREEEKSRSKERIFSLRNDMGAWDPKNQRPELWNIYNTKYNLGETMRVFPLSNWTEVDIWAYIRTENIEIAPLYFSENRRMVKRNDLLIQIDDYTKPFQDEEIIEAMARYRTLGCAPSTGATLSTALSLDDIIFEVINAKNSERENRGLDRTSVSSMEQKKKEGHF